MDSNFEKLSQDALEEPKQYVEHSPFEIRLNTTYRALLLTKENIDIAIAEELTSRLDDIIDENSEEADINIIYHDPTRPAYTNGKVRAYYSWKTRDPKDLWEALQPDYGLTPYRSSNDNPKKTPHWIEIALSKDPRPFEELEALMSRKPDLEGPDFDENSEDTESEEVNSVDIESEEVGSENVEPEEVISEPIYREFNLLDYDSRFELRYDESDPSKKSDFSLFFAIRLATEDISVIDDFLDFHLIHNFKNSIDQFNRFLNLLCTEYKERIFNQGKCEIIKQWKPSPLFTHNTESPLLPDGASEGTRKKSGRPVKDKIELPIPPKREIGSDEDNIRVCFG